MLLTGHEVEERAHSPRAAQVGMRQEPDAEALARLGKGQLAQPFAVRVAQERRAKSGAHCREPILVRVHLLAALRSVFLYFASSGAEDDETQGAVWREVGLGSWVLNALGVRRIHLLASRELSFPGIASFGLSIETVIKEL